MESSRSVLYRFLHDYLDVGMTVLEPPIITLYIGCWERLADSRKVWNIVFFFFFFYIMVVYCSFLLFLVFRNLIFFRLFSFVLFCCFVFILFFLFCFCCCCFYVFFCFRFWIFGLSFCPLRHFPSVLHLFLPIAVASCKQCQHFGRLH